MAMRERVVVLVDMDCFYVQVEQRRCPELKGKPCAVVQYNAWKGGGIIAVSYEARAHGVTRSMRGDEAKKKCPDIRLVQVPVSRGKANLTHYREAGAEVLGVLSGYCDNCERASVDEAYLDITNTVQQKLSSMTITEIVDKSWQTTVIEGISPYDAYSSNLLGLKKDWQMSMENDSHIKSLAVGAIITAEMRKAVLEKSGFTCSAGIAENKMLAKLSCGLHKPNQQTLLPQPSVEKLFTSMPLRKVRSLGGKLGSQVSSELNVEFMGDLVQFTMNELTGHFGGKNGELLYQLCRGIDHEPVRPRQLPKSVSCGKNFPGKTKLATVQQVQHWLSQLVGELHERLTKEADVNARQATLLTVSLRMEDSASCSRSCALQSVEADWLTKRVYDMLLSFKVDKGRPQSWEPAITNLYLGASKFTETASATFTPAINSYFSSTTSSVASVPSESTTTAAASMYSANITTTTAASVSEPDGTQNTAKDTAIEGKGKPKSMRGSIDAFLMKGQQSSAFSSDTPHDELKCTSTSNSLYAVDNHSRPPEEPRIFSKHSFSSNEGLKMPSPGKSPNKNGIWAFLCRKEPGKDEQEIQNRSSSELYIPSTSEEVFTSNISEDSLSVCGISSTKVVPVTDATRKPNESRIQWRGCTDDTEAGAYSTDPNTSACENYPSTLLSDEDFVLCDKCHRRISAWGLPEHLDFHFAEQLQRESEVSHKPKSPPRKKLKSSSHDIKSFFNS